MNLFIKKSKKTLRGVLILLLAVFVLPLGMARAIDNVFSGYDLYLLVGEIEHVGVNQLTRVSLADPGIADLIEATEDEIVIIGKQPGQTPLFIWDEAGKQTVMVYVAEQKLEEVEERIKMMLKTIDIFSVRTEINEKEGKVFLIGEILKEKKEDFQEVLDTFRTVATSFVKEREVKDLIEINIQITELSTSLTRSLGVDWSVGGGPTVEGFGSGGFIKPTYVETPPETDGSIADFFKIGDFNRTHVMLAQISALLEEGKARVLSKPKIVVVSGEEATFLIGGEVPIRTTSTAEASVTENVEFKAYGINMTVSPEILDEKIGLTLSVEVSEIDGAHVFAETAAFNTRSADTHLLLDNGQTIVLAGLIKKSQSEKKRMVPFLHSVPVLGLLFRSKSMTTPDEDLEMVIALTPQVLARNRGKTDEYIINNKGSLYGADVSTKHVSAVRDSTPYYAGMPKEMVEYVGDLQRKISQASGYPKEASARGWQGTVRVGMLILRDGTLAFALVKESSGHDIFDDISLKTVKQMAPFSKFPSGTDLQQLSVTIPIVYSLDN